LAAANGITLHELSPQLGSLEEAFMQLTKESVEYHAAD
jgi:ABC-2 type transport system ATP-binding protein